MHPSAPLAPTMLRWGMFALILTLAACDGSTFDFEKTDEQEQSANPQEQQPEQEPETEPEPEPQPAPEPEPEPGPEPTPEPEPVQTYSSIAYPIKSNDSRQHSNTGPQSVSNSNESNFPGLRYGDFLFKNNAWNLFNTTYRDWYQTITLEEVNNRVIAKVDWDYGVQSDLRWIYAVTSYPELIYGVKSAYEVSANFEETGLPVQVNESPQWVIDYDFSYEERLSANNNFSSTPDSEYNVAIESFWHSSCDIQRDDDPQRENRVFELMVWLKVKQRKPSGQPPVARVSTSDGRSFDVYTKSDNRQYIAYVATQEFANGTIRYSELIDDAISNASAYGIYQIKQTDCMANILMYDSGASLQSAPGSI